MTVKTGCGCTSCSSSSASSGITNRPGLSSLSYRIGTYDSFFAAMKLRLSGQDLSFPSAIPPLRALTTRDQDDPAIALLDAWAVLGDVLTFYQERIANEGYLRTATERQSIAALAALVGAELRPGISASTYLAYTIDPTISNGFVAAGSKVQSVPGPGETAQTFETSEDLSAVGVFSTMTPRLTRPQILSTDTSIVYLVGLSNNISLNDPLLSGGDKLPRRVQSLRLDTANNRTTVTLQAATQASAAGLKSNADVAELHQTSLPTIDALTTVLPSLLKAPAVHPANALDLKRRIADVYQPGLDTAPNILRALNPGAADEIYPALSASQVAPLNPSQISAFRTKAAVYGNNAPLKPVTNAQGIVIGTEEWPLAGLLSIRISLELIQEQSSSGVILKRQEASTPSSASSIQITQGSTSAMASFTSTDTSVQVGTWTATLTGNLSSGSVTINIGALDREYTITSTSGGPYKLIAGSASLSALASQSASSDVDGREIVLTVGSNLVVSDNSPAALSSDQLGVISLDSVYEKIVPGSTIYIERADNPAQSMTAIVSKTSQRSLTAYNLSARVTQLTLSAPWLDPKTDLMLTVARSTTVYAQNEVLPLAEEPIADLIAGDTVEMGELYSDLQPGRWLIVSGERADLGATSGIEAAEVVMLASVQQGTQQIAVVEPVNTSGTLTSTSVSDGSAGAPASATTKPVPGSPPSNTAPPGSSTPTTALQSRAGETTHSFLKFASPLAYTYKRPSVTIYGNVVPATNGETRKEVIGSGDSSQTFQQFSLHASPLTYTSAPTQSGSASSLAIYVNGIQWHEMDSLIAAGPTDRIFTTSVDNQNKVTVTFGDGQHGMRLPTGRENVQAIYRTGIGAGANLDAGKLTLLSTKPLGAKAVTNPVIASGGADRDDAEGSRRNTPLAAIALDRLVSVSDYASFARTFAGIGKATSSMLAVNQSSTIVVSVAGSEGSELAADSQVVQQLTLAFHKLGDPNIPVEVIVADPLLIILSARVETLADYPWTTVAPLVTAALLARFSFDLQTPGTPVYLSSIIATIQQVTGVAYAVVDGFDTISRSEVDSSAAFTAKMAELRAQTTIPSRIPLRLEYIDATGTVHPSRVAYLSPDLPDTLLLSEIPS